MDTRAPEGLGGAGQELWQRATGAYDFGGEQLAVLHMLCTQADRIQECQEAIAEHGVVVTDRRGALKSNPACRLEQQAVWLFVRLANQLGLLEEAEQATAGRPKVYRAGRK